MGIYEIHIKKWTQKGSHALGQTSFPLQVAYTHSELWRCAEIKMYNICLNLLGHFE